MKLSDVLPRLLLSRPASSSDEGVHISSRLCPGGQVRSIESSAFCMRHTLEMRALDLAAWQTQRENGDPWGDTIHEKALCGWSVRREEKSISEGDFSTVALWQAHLRQIFQAGSFQPLHLIGQVVHDYSLLLSFCLSNKLELQVESLRIILTSRYLSSYLSSCDDTSIHAIHYMTLCTYLHSCLSSFSIFLSPVLLLY